LGDSGYRTSALGPPAKSTAHRKSWTSTVKTALPEKVNELLPIDFEMGFGRLLHPEDDQPFHAGMGPTSFDFTDDCCYGALSIKGDQYKAIGITNPNEG